MGRQLGLAPFSVVCAVMMGIGLVFSYAPKWLLATP